MMLVVATSKVPFYIAGGVLVLWALTLSGFAINHASFPAGVMGQRGVVLATLVLAAATVATAIVTA